MAKFNTFFLIILSLYLSATAFAANPGKQVYKEEDIETLIQEGNAYLKATDYVLLARTARVLQELGDESGNGRARLYGNMFKAHYLSTLPSDSARYYYMEALEIARKLSDDRAISSIFNGLGVYTIDVEMNYLKGISYFMEALPYAEAAEDKYIYPIVLSNLAMTYYLRSDPEGLKYALEVYSLGQGLGDAYLISSGAFISACMYYLLGNNDKVLELIDVVIAHSGEYTPYVELYTLKANTLLRFGMEAEAVRNFEEALRYADRAQVHSLTMAYLNYGEYMLGKGSVNKAISLLESGVEISHAKNNAVHRYRLYEKLSDAYLKMGNPYKALELYRLYHEESDSIFNVERERSINELRIQYETEKHEKELQEKELELVKKHQSTQLIAFALVVIIIISLALSLLYRRKNAMYKQLVKQQHDFLQREKQKEALESLVLEKGAEPRYSVSSLTDEKGVEMYESIERAMKHDRLYKDSELTLEKLADIMHTNRSYISQVINEYAGVSYKSYINSYRMNDAVRILSDPDSDVQIKGLAFELGFNSRQTFYQAFQNSFGMPPSKYREQITKLYSGVAKPPKE